MVFLWFPIDFPMNKWWISIGFWYVSRKVPLETSLCRSIRRWISAPCSVRETSWSSWNAAAWCVEVSSERSRFWGIRSFQLDGFKVGFFYYWEMFDLRLNGFIYGSIYVGWCWMDLPFGDFTYPLVSSNMAGRKIPELNGGFDGKIMDVSDLYIDAGFPS